MRCPSFDIAHASDYVKRNLGNYIKCTFSNIQGIEEWKIYAWKTTKKLIDHFKLDMKTILFHFWGQGILNTRFLNIILWVFDLNSNFIIWKPESMEKIQTNEYTDLLQLSRYGFLEGCLYQYVNQYFLGKSVYFVFMNCNLRLAIRYYIQCVSNVYPVKVLACMIKSAKPFESM